MTGCTLFWIAWIAMEISLGLGAWFWIWAHWGWRQPVRWAIARMAMQVLGIENPIDRFQRVPCPLCRPVNARTWWGMTRHGVQTATCPMCLGLGAIDVQPEPAVYRN